MPETNVITPDTGAGKSAVDCTNTKLFLAFAIPELVIFQLLPSLTTVRVDLLLESNIDALPSIVCEEVVATVNTVTGLVVLAFLIVYTLPAQPVASGNVTVEAEVPVNKSVLSVEAAVVELVNAL